MPRPQTTARPRRTPLRAGPDAGARMAIDPTGAMTFIDDPSDARYADEADVRRELSRVASTCFECRRCVDRCGVFPGLIDLLGRIDDHDAGRLTPEEQDGIADACFHCGDCLVGCPYAPGADDAAIDMPRAMARIEAVRNDSVRRPRRDRIATAALARPRLVRRLVGASPPKSLRRRTVAAVAGLSATSPALARRVAPDAAAAGRSADAPARAVIVTGCTHDGFDGRVVADAMAVYARLGVTCEVLEVGSCGAISLQSGELARFGRTAARNVRRLADSTGSSGARFVVIDATCRSMIVDEYPRHLTGEARAEAARVGSRVVDVFAHVRELLDGRDLPSIPETVTVHAGCRTRAGSEAESIRRLLVRLGARVVDVEGCSAVGTVCGQRSIKDVAVTEVAVGLASRILPAPDDGTVLVSTCGATAAALAERTGSPVVHPISLLAQALTAPNG